MKAGRELDVLIERHIFKSNIGEEIMAWEVPHYSTNIADAWLVMEKFKGEGWLFSLKNIIKGTFTFSLTNWGGNCNTYAAEAETAPLAICLAALKAVGEGDR